MASSGQSPVDAEKDLGSHDGHNPVDSSSLENKLGQRKENGMESPANQDTIEYLTGLRLALVISTILLSTVLAALEIGIIATAIPGITDDFHKLDDVGWYGSSTFLLFGASAPMWGKMYKYLSVKYTYIGSMAVYLIASIVGGAAPNSVSVIVSRALQGLGAAGTLGGSVLVINYVSKPSQRPILIGAWMGTFMISTILGPVIGGAFTSGVSWRWCFWINLPLGGPILVLLWFFLNVPKHIKPAPATWKEIILQMDFPGFGVVLAALVCLTLALQWGGLTKSWDDGSVIATLVLFVVLILVFVVVEWFQGPRAMVPLALLRPRTTWANALYCYISNCPFYQIMFYLPIYFQSIHGFSAVKSGVCTLPFLAFFSLGAVVSGGLIGKTRYLQPYQLTSTLLMTAGMALFYTMDVDTSSARYFGPQILFGFGLGLGNQIPMTAVQGFSKPEDVANSTGIMLMCQSMSGATFLVVAQSIFSNRLLESLRHSTADIDPLEVINTGASEIGDIFTGQELEAVIRSYMDGLKDVYLFGLAGSAAAVLLSLVIPFKRLPDADSKKVEEKERHQA
uniref:ResE n=1 Tax=Sarocladium zeae TaxID=1036732 RepID=X4YJV9_9HYPO|nr:ResE [Sarocladium zeae]